MHKIILADNQMIFRAGVSRVLSLEPEMKIVAQCADMARLHEALQHFPGSLVVFPSSLEPEVGTVIDAIMAAGGRTILVVEHGSNIDEAIAQRVEGMVMRSVSAAELVETIHRVAAGDRVVQRESVQASIPHDRVGQRVLERLTPKELQIVALVGEGFKNREIAEHLSTKEQVVKNYLRSIYDKTGVSDRLELALFTVHHPTLAEATERVLLKLKKIA
jgi:DNA-binding NarL/FixJ family response regulator